MKRLKLFSLIIVIVAGGGGFFYWQHTKAVSEAERYVTAAVTSGDVEQVVSASGTLNPVKLVNVGTQISGVVRALNADFNDKVEEGQVLAELDQSLLITQLDQSKSALVSANSTAKLAEADYNREKQLFDQGYVAKADLDKAEQVRVSAQADVKNAKAEIERDTVNLGYSVIHSPVSGVIISRQIDIGQTVAASFQTPTLFTIAQDLKKMQIDTSLSEADVGAVKEKMPVRFTVDAFPGRQFAGTVRQIRLNPTNVSNVVTYDVVIDVENEDLTLLPGMTAFVTLVEAEHPDVLKIPNAALMYKPADRKPGTPHKDKNKDGDDAKKADENIHGIYLLKDGEVTRVKVKVGITDGKFTEISGDEIKEGDLVVTEDTQAKKPSSAAAARMGGMGGGMGFR